VPLAEGGRKVKEIKAFLPDDLALKLEELTTRSGLSREEVIHQAVAEYVEKLEAATAFDPVGYGMWRNREDLRDAAKWVEALRRREWRC
jgi:predicted transcriptional regulator